MEVPARKISFQEAWDSTTIFFVDDTLEEEIDLEVEALLAIAKDPRISEDAVIEENTIFELLVDRDNALDVILRDIELSEEKFMRIITLLRKLGRIPGGFTVGDTEWGFDKVKKKIKQEPDFRQFIAKLLVRGKNDAELSAHIPRYYLDTLNYNEIKGSSLAARRIRS